MVWFKKTRNGDSKKQQIGPGSKPGNTFSSMRPESRVPSLSPDHHVACDLAYPVIPHRQGTGYAGWQAT
jgi:hypothetical protein